MSELVMFESAFRNIPVVLGFCFLPVEDFSILNLCHLPQETVPRCFNEHEFKECCPICLFEIK